MNTPAPQFPAKVFVSYAREDEDLLNDLEGHLAALTRQGKIELWHDGKIGAGKEWERKIIEELEEADIILLLVSPAFMASEFCYGREMTRALERHESGNATVVPVILRPVLWETAPFGRLQALPAQGRPVTRWRSRDEAFLDVARGVEEAVERLAVSPTSATASAEGRTIIRKPTEGELLRIINAIEFVTIPSGTFLMGSDDGGENERPVHEETIPKLFELSAYVITQLEWRVIMSSEPWKGREFVEAADDHPAVYVTWYDVKAFIAKINSIDSSFYYRLPTEAEWEYAARAGTSTRFSFGDDERALNGFGWYDQNSYNAGVRHAHPVGRKRPNEWGLYDMHGNVWEWVEDWYHGSYAAPAGPADEKVVRGGGYDYTANGARSSFRNHVAPNRCNHVIGFPLVRQHIE
jgi:formylglycine-generating enzyme required for sulfatase activity